MNYVLHTYYSENKVHPRKTALIKLKVKKNGKDKRNIEVQANSFCYLKNRYKPECLLL
jgi:sulfur relay (sulfurtransferase) DsrC/TusE family protein